MHMRLRVGLLLCLAAAAAYSSAAAFESLRPVQQSHIPQEIYSDLICPEDSAEFLLKDCNGYVAVYEGRKSKIPVDITGIELSRLREADRAMINAGIPVATRNELLELLEDLGP